jgi:hypothetical protein
LLNLAAEWGLGDMQALRGAVKLRSSATILK